MPNSPAPALSERAPRRWRWLELWPLIEWRRWGLGVEFALHYWSPPEWSMHVHIGPVLWAIGVEESYEYRDWVWDHADAARASSQGGKA